MISYKLVIAVRQMFYDIISFFFFFFYVVSLTELNVELPRRRIKKYVCSVRVFTGFWKFKFQIRVPSTFLPPRFLLSGFSRAPGVVLRHSKTPRTLQTGRFGQCPQTKMSSQRARRLIFFYNNMCFFSWRRVFRFAERLHSPATPSKRITCFGGENRKKENKKRTW